MSRNGSKRKKNILRTVFSRVWWTRTSC